MSGTGVVIMDHDIEYVHVACVSATSVLHPRPILAANSNPHMSRRSDRHDHAAAHLELCGRSDIAHMGRMDNNEQYVHCGK